MELSPGAVGLITTTFIASAVEFVEALTIVLAMGVTRSWRSALVGTAVAALLLAAVTAVVGITLVSFISKSLLQVIIGPLLLIFGLQWLRKAILRSSGLKAMHDEEESFRRRQAMAKAAGHEVRLGLDWFSFVISCKGVFLEGLEVVFIVITFGLSATTSQLNGIPIAAASAVAAGLVVVLAGAIVHRPLANVPENTMKYVVGLMLSTFGTFWGVEGLGVFSVSGKSLEWPGEDLALLGILVGWFLLSRLAIAGLRRLPSTRPVVAVTPAQVA